MQNRPAGFIFGCAMLIAAAMTVVSVTRADAMCCVCRGGGCNTGFCVDNLAGASACTDMCTAANCPNVVFDNSDACVSTGGCGVAGDVATATPSSTPTLTGTPTDSPSPTPSSTPTASATTTRTVTNTATVTNTPTITDTPTITATATRTPTPLECCQQAGPACGPPS